MNNYVIVACATPNLLWTELLRGGLKYKNPISDITKLNISNLVSPDYNIFTPLEWTFILRNNLPYL